MKHVHTIEKSGAMQTSVKIYANDAIFADMNKDKCVIQGTHVAQLPGIHGSVLMMPDAHQGYGFPIGGVAAMDTCKGCLSPGGVGFDINCGMRCLVTNLSYADIKERVDELLEAIFQVIPVGVGKDSDIKLTHDQLDVVMVEGAKWALRNGYGVPEDLVLTEEEGCMKDANPAKVSPSARKRGKNQLGTLGAGNHFIEIQRVGDIFNDQVASAFGITSKDQIVIMIHSGSRGFGHQICTDYLRKIEDAYPDVMDALPEKDLAYAPINSSLAKDYYEAMCCAMNFAWCNRQVMTGKIRKVFVDLFPDCQVDMLYDMSHNNAKLEEHIIDGSLQKVWVHRKGAARAFGPGRKEVPEKYRALGQPVIIPGSMGTGSYLCVGTESGMKETYGTTCHGAGRKMSRRKALATIDPDQVVAGLKANAVHLRSGSKRGVVDEAPEVYKDVDEVVAVCDDVGIAKMVVKLLPVGVLKG